MLKQLCAKAAITHTTSHSGSPAPSDSMSAPQADKNGSRLDSSGTTRDVDCSTETASASIFNNGFCCVRIRTSARTLPDVADVDVCCLAFTFKYAKF